VPPSCITVQQGHGKLGRQGLALAGGKPHALTETTEGVARQLSVAGGLAAERFTGLRWQRGLGACGGGTRG
jgi:hypothetical protein